MTFSIINPFLFHLLSKEKESSSGKSPLEGLIFKNIWSAQIGLDVP